MFKIGAYIYYKLANPEKTDRANDFLENQEEQEELRELDSGRVLWFWSEKDREIEKRKQEEKGYGVPDFFDIGEGQFKISGIGVRIYDRVKYRMVKLFEKLHKNFEIKVLSSSCGLRTDYLDPEEISTITNNGKALSGSEKQEILEIIAEN